MGDLRGQDAHCDVTLMCDKQWICSMQIYQISKTHNIKYHDEFNRCCHNLHDDVIKWKQHPLVTGLLWGETTGQRWIPLTKASGPKPLQWRHNEHDGVSNHKGPVTRNCFPLDDVIIFDFPLICVQTNGWTNNWDPGDLRRHRAHYNVAVKDIWVYVVIKDIPPILILKSNLAESRSSRLPNRFEICI